MSIMIRDENIADIENTDYSTISKDELLHKLEYYNKLLRNGYIGMWYGFLIEEKDMIEKELEKREIEEIIE